MCVLQCCYSVIIDMNNDNNRNVNDSGNNCKNNYDININKDCRRGNDESNNDGNNDINDYTYNDANNYRLTFRYLAIKNLGHSDFRH